MSKQDDENPKYRSRFVAKEINRSPMPGLYVATPPLECLRVIISDVMTQGARSEPPRKLMVCDVSRAYFYAPSIQFSPHPVRVEPEIAKPKLLWIRALNPDQLLRSHIVYKSTP